MPRLSCYLLLNLIAALCFTAPVAAEELAHRVLLSFDSADEIKALASKGEGIVCEHVDGALKITLQKGQAWSSLLFEGELLKGWEQAEWLALDLSTENAEGAELLLDLQDAQSRDFASRATLPAVKLEQGKQTLKWKLTQLKRNGQENAAWETVPASERLNVSALTKVKLFTTPPKEKDWIVTIDNVRLISKDSAALEAEKREKENAKSTEQVAYFADFENGKGLGGEGVQFKGNWLPLDAGVKAEIAAPLGEKGANASAKVLSVKATAKANSICMELPLHGTIVEPEGWDGFVSLKVYNGGYGTFQMTYSPVIPSDITFHRVDFDAPKNQWTQLEIPLDKFLHQQRRPRRGCPLEYLCLIGMTPENEGATFQIDDVRVYRKRRENVPQRAPKPALPAGVTYLQNFDDANDFDIQSYFPSTRNANAFRADGGVDDSGKPWPDENDAEKAKLHGALQIACYERKQEFSAGRLLGFDGAGQQIVFDVRVSGVSDFAVVTRSASGRWRQYSKIESGKWTRITLSSEEFAKFGTAPKEGIEKKLSRAEKFSGLYFGGYADESGKALIEIDNLCIRKAE